MRDLDLANAWRPDVLVVDEAQRIKNWDTRAARALKRLDSRYAVVLTGTPLENRLEDLLSVVQLVDRHRLGPTWRFLHDHQLRDETGRVTGYRDLDRIGQTLAPILLRRRKTEVLEQLPERRDLNLFVPLTKLQRELHEEYAGIVARLVQRWRRHRHLSEADRKRLQAALLRMRMVCDSSHLVAPNTEEGHKIPELLAWLDERLADREAKVVVFSAWLDSHALIARELDARGIGYVLFNGGVPAKQRGALVDRFRNDPDCRLFLATDAGGVGLNLQHAASLIVNLDLPWNPAVLEQRIGRVYRLGQQRKVEVVNFIAENSIEHNMLGLLHFKRALFEGVLEGGERDVRLEGTRLSRFMEGVKAVTGAAPTQASCTVAEPADEAVTADSADKLESAAPTAASPLRPDDVAKAGPTDRANGQGAAVSAVTLAPLLRLAGSWLGQVAEAMAGPGESPLIERDTKTGAMHIRLPVPDAATLRSVAKALQALLPSEQE